MSLQVQVKFIQLRRKLVRSIAGWLALSCALLPWSAYAQQVEGASDYEAALIEHDAGEVVEAAILLKRELQRNPRHVPSILLLGEIYAENGIWSAAETAFRQALNLGADPLRASRLLAESLFAQQRAEEVLRDFIPSDYRGPAKLEIHAIRGEAHLIFGDFGALRRELEDAGPDAARNHGLSLLEVSLLLHRGQTDQAESRAQEIIQRAAYRAESWTMAASVAHQRGDTDLALERYARAIELAPRRGDARVARLALLLDAERNTEMAADIEFFEAQRSNDPRASYLRALWLAEQGRLDESREVLREVVYTVSQYDESRFTDSNVQLMMLSGLANYGLELYNSAVDALRRYLARRPDDVGARKVLADALLRSNQPAKALVEIHSSLEQFPDDVSLLVLMATAQSDLENFEAASQHLQSALRLEDLPDLEVAQAGVAIAAGEMAAGVQILQALLEKQPDYDRAGFALMVAHMRENENEAAITVAREFLRLTPDNLAIRNLLGVALMNTGQLQTARQEFESCIAQDPKFGPALVNLAEWHRSQGDYDNALTLLEDLVKQRPDSAQLLVKLSSLQVAAGDFKGGKDNAELAFDLAPEHVEVGLHLAELIIGEGDTRSAATFSQRLENAFPDDPRVLALRARYLISQQDMEAAQGMLKTLRQAANNDFFWLVETGGMQLRQGFFDDAVETFALAHLYHDAEILAHLGLIEAMLRAGRSQRALELANAGADRFGEDAEFTMLRAESLAAVGRLKEALAEFDRAVVAGAPGMAVVRGSHMLAGMNRLGDAEARLRRALDMAGPDATILQGLGELYLTTARFADAVPVYQQLKELQPEDARVQNNLAVSLGQVGNFVEAARAARDALEQEPDNALYNDTLGWILYRDGKLNEALGFLREAHVRNWGDGEIRLHLVQCLADLGRTSEAMRLLREGLDNLPGYHAQPGVQEMLQQLEGRAQSS